MPATEQNVAATLAPLGLPPEGSFRQPDAWEDYGAKGLTPDDVPALIAVLKDARRITGDDGVYAVRWHAWRAVSRLGDASATPAMLEILDRASRDDDETACEELPHAIASLGPGAVPHLAGFIADQRRDGYARTYTASAARMIAKAHPAAREPVVRAIAQALELGRFNDPGHNALLIIELIELGASETEPLVRSLYARGLVDTMTVGREDDVIKDLTSRGR